MGVFYNMKKISILFLVLFIGIFSGNLSTASAAKTKAFYVGGLRCDGNSSGYVKTNGAADAWGTTTCERNATYLEVANYFYINGSLKFLKTSSTSNDSWVIADTLDTTAKGSYTSKTYHEFKYGGETKTGWTDYSFTK